MALSPSHLLTATVADLEPEPPSRVQSCPKLRDIKMRNGCCLTSLSLALLRSDK